MIELRLFGGFEVTGPDRDRARSVLSQPRRAALLAYLAALGPRGPVRRDRLTQMFWPEADATSGRQSLRQALAFLRHALGDRAIVTRGETRGEEEVGIDPIEVRCDVAALDRYLDAGDVARAAELYRGELLAGFLPSGVGAFERWLDETRNDYKRRMGAALRTLAEREAAGGNAALAAHWARRELTLEPVDEDSAMHLMRRLAAAGDNAGALAAYDDLVKLERDLDDEPSPEVAALAAEIRAMSTVFGPTTTASAAPAARAAPPRPAIVETRSGQTGDFGSSPRSPRITRWRGKRLAAAGAPVTLIVAIALWIGLRPKSGVSRALSGERQPTLAIMPFRVGGAGPELAYLREGIVDLLTNRLGDDPGWFVDPQATMAGARAAARAAAPDVTVDDALRIGSELGAREVLTGGIVGSGARVSIEGTLRAVSDGAVRLTVSAEGPADSISVLVDRIAARLLFYRTGYEAANPDALARKPLAELREFLRGHAALRKGQYSTALPAFERALAKDSAFAQAELGLGAAGRRLGEWAPWQRGLGRAWAHRSALGLADSLYLVALNAPRPATNRRWSTVAPTQAEILRAWEQVVQVTPARPEGWYELGDQLLRWGPVIGVADARPRARAALERALELDPSMVEPVLPLIEICIATRDTAAVRRLYTRYVATHASGEAEDYLRWRVALFLGDVAERNRLLGTIDRMSYGNQLQIVGMGQLDGVGLDDVARVVEVLGRRAQRINERAATATVIWHWRLNQAKPGTVTDLPYDAARPERGDLRELVLNGLYAGADESVAARSAAALERPPMLAPATEGAVRSLDLCITEQWRIWHGDPTNTRAAVAYLRDVDRPAGRICAYLLEAMSAVLASRPGATAALETLDVQLRIGDRPEADEPYMNLAAARLWERMGNPRRALAAVRRRAYHHWTGPWYLSSFLEAEQRLARVTGDTAEAHEAERHLNALRQKH